MEPTFLIQMGESHIKVLTEAEFTPLAELAQLDLLLAIAKLLERIEAHVSAGTK